MEVNISFDLSLPEGYTNLPVPIMLARGYKRAFVVQCFENLEMQGFGTFERGSQGRGKVGKFMPNDNCPITFDMTFQKKNPGRPKKMRAE